MKLLVRLEEGRCGEGRRCEGCAAIGYVEEKTGLCLYCFGLKVNVERRKRKLEETARARFLELGAKIREQMKEFQVKA